MPNEGLCLRCRGHGKPGGCPACGKDSLLVIEQKVVLTEELAAQTQIPKQYLAVEWDEAILRAGHPHMAKSNDFDRYCRTLTNTIRKIKSGGRPDRSVILIADRGYGKRTFAYCYLKECIKLGLNVTSIIDTTQYKRLNRVSSERPFDKTITQALFSIEQLDSADVLFVTVDPDNYRSALSVLDSICDKRSRQGKPTIITSRFSVRQMSLFDYSGRDPDRFLGTASETDKFKFPTPIMVTEVRKSL